jgi:cyclopropane fatty-acyl-phospholipid synthase-like methyltransferase
MLLASLAPQAGERILHLSVRGARSGLALAKQFPEAYFVAVETEETAVVAINKKVRAQKITNLEVLPLVGWRFHSEAASFDKAVSLLMLHSLQPADKLAFLKEILRVLRRGGTLHIGNLDTPQTSREQSGLKLARYLFGEAAAQAHLDGTWVKMLREVGFSGIRHMASYSTTLGRVVLVRARRPIN